jgi:hypothetical protein
MQGCFATVALMVKWLNGLPFAWENHPMERSEIRMDNAMECNDIRMDHRASLPRKMAIW